MSETPLTFRELVLRSQARDDLWPAVLAIKREIETARGDELEAIAADLRAWASSGDNPSPLNGAVLQMPVREPTDATAR